MNKKLFLLCPASQVEHLLRKEHKEAYFLTALAAVFSLKEQEGLEQLTEFIRREKVGEVFVVNDVSCRFIKNVITRQKGFGTYAEQVLIDLYIEHYQEVMDNTALQDQCYRLAELNVQRQIEELLAVDCFLQQVVLQKIRISGLVTCLAEGRIKDVRANELALSV